MNVTANGVEKCEDNSMYDIELCMLGQIAGHSNSLASNLSMILCKKTRPKDQTKEPVIMTEPEQKAYNHKTYPNKCQIVTKTKKLQPW